MTELECDAPPYFIVTACNRYVDFYRPADSVWHQVPEIAGGTRPAGMYCRCGASFPALCGITFDLSSGGTVYYWVGQCRQCLHYVWTETLPGSVPCA